MHTGSGDTAGARPVLYQHARALLQANGGSMIVRITAVGSPHACRVYTYDVLKNPIQRRSVFYPTLPLSPPWVHPTTVPPGPHTQPPPPVPRGRPT